jgi:hypothetical protein
MQGKIEFQRDFQVVKSPADAPRKFVLKIAAQDQPLRCAMRTMLRARNLKQATVAQALHIDVSYVNKLVNEKAPMPDWFPEKFCGLCRSNLLLQVMAHEDREAEAEDTARWLERKLANELRQVAA